MIQRECGVLKTTYEADMGLYPLPIAKWTVAAVGVLFFLIIPLTLHEYFLSVANLVWIAVIGALGLNILVGYTGQVSIGHGAFMSVGAYTAANLANRLGSPWPVNLLAGVYRSEEHTSELQSLRHLVCRLLLEKKKKFICTHNT